jgi:hypothetical protein
MTMQSCARYPRSMGEGVQRGGARLGLWQRAIGLARSSVPAHLCRRIRAQLAARAVSQSDLLGCDGDRAVDAVENHDRTDARTDDDAAANAFGDLHLLTRVQYVDVAPLTALDIDTDAQLGPLRHARARRLKEGLVREERTLNALARARTLPSPIERTLLLLGDVRHVNRWEAFCVTWRLRV